MPKKYMLKEVDASSETGDKIIVEQIFENEDEFIWSPLSKVVITDKVINLNEDFTFTHPRTGKLFKVLNKQNEY